MIVIMFSLNKLINCQRYSSLLLSSLFVSFYFCSLELLCRPNQTWLAAICHIKVNWNQNIRSRVDRLFIPSTATAHTSIYWQILTRQMHITLCTAIRNKKREQNPPNASIWRSSPPDTKDPKCFHLKVLSITSHSLPTPIKCIKIHCYLVIQIPLFQNLKPSVIIPRFFSMTTQYSKLPLILLTAINKWLAVSFELPGFGLLKLVGCLELKWV